MHRLTLAAGGLLLAASGPAIAHGLGAAGDLEHARANARAGGPINEYDAELLERYGCESGTQSAFCKLIRHGANSGDYRKYRRRLRPGN